MCLCYEGSVSGQRETWVRYETLLHYGTGLLTCMKPRALPLLSLLRGWNRGCIWVFVCGNLLEILVIRILRGKVLKYLSMNVVRHNRLFVQRAPCVCIMPFFYPNAHHGCAHWLAEELSWDGDLQMTCDSSSVTPVHRCNFISFFSW